MNPSQIERLEPRTLLADTTVSIHPLVNASETDPTGTGVGQFTLRRIGDTSTIIDVNVRFSTGASTATQDSDIETTLTKVRLARGRAHAHFKVFAIDDAIAEPTEIIVMKVMPSPNYDVNPTRTVA